MNSIHACISGGQDEAIECINKAKNLSLTAEETLQRILSNKEMRNLGLDLLRLVAVVLVLGRHMHLPETENLFLKTWQTGGWIGVDLFFVLSGFLVSGLLFREYQRSRTVDLKRFLIRRGLKIYPAFYALIAFTVCYRFLTEQSMGWRPLVGELLFIQNYTGGLWNHTWSLAVEEHFYIGIAVLCFFVIRTSPGPNRGDDPFRIIPAVFAIVASICLSLRIGNLFLFETYSHKEFLFGTHLRIDSLMFGVLLSYYWHFRDLESRLLRVRTWWLIATGLLLLAPAFLFPLEHYKAVSVFGVILFFLGSGCLVLAAVRLRSSQNPFLALCGALGAASYSIYLWHMPLATWGWAFVKGKLGLEGYLPYVLFYMLGSLLFGWMMSKVIEWPILKIRDKLFPKDSQKTNSVAMGSIFEGASRPAMNGR